MRPFVLVFAYLLPCVTADEHVFFRERLQIGDRYHVKTRVDLTGSFTPPPIKGSKPQTVELQGASSIDYEERLLAFSDKGEVTRTARLTRRFDFSRTLAGQKQQIGLRPEIKRLVILRQGPTEIPFSPDGPLTWGELDVVRTDVFVPALLGLLPREAVRVGDRWKASDLAVQELTDLEKIESGSLECRLESISSPKKNRMATIRFTGMLKGISEDGPVSHRLTGSVLYDLDEQFFTTLILNGTMTLTSPKGEALGKVEGRFALERSRDSRSEELSDVALKGVKLEPDEENTRLLYDNPLHGVRFVYPRSWRVAREAEGQIALDSGTGCGLLITLDAAGKTPTLKQLQEEARAWMTKNKGTILREIPSATLRTRPRLEAFSLETKLEGQSFWMDYYLTDQPEGGASLAARLVAKELAQTRKEVEAIARSLTRSRPLPTR
ncbi:MAG: hypothetical protein SNJ75_03135 [Gemmataceae bacterium]